MNKGEVEEKLNLITAQFYKKIVGKGPKRVRITIIDDLIIVRIERYDNIIFNNLKRSEEGVELLKMIRKKLFNLFKNEIKAKYENLISQEIKEIYYDSEKVASEIVLTITIKENIL